MIPKVKFEAAPLKHYINMIYHKLNPRKEDWDWSDRIFKNYPGLEKKLKGINDYDKRVKIIYDFFKQTEKNKKVKLRESCLRFQRSWNKINNKALEALSEVVEINWPKNTMKIAAYVTLNPICPRWIKKRTFDIYYKFNIRKMKAVSLHEILHFIYFEKWKQVFPKTKEREFDKPYLVWQLSEMVPPIILKDERIQKVFRHKPPAYKEYVKFKIDKKPLLEYFQEFYDNKKDFEDFLKQSWKFVKEHKKEIMSI